MKDHELTFVPGILFFVLFLFIFMALVLHKRETARQVKSTYVGIFEYIQN